MGIDNFAQRTKRRVPWLFSVLLAGIVSYLLGRTATSDFNCPNFQEAYVIFISSLITLVCIVRGVFKKSLSQIGKLLVILITITAGVGIPYFSGKFIAQTPWAILQFCPVPPTTYIDHALEMLESGELSAAEKDARRCIDLAIDNDQVNQCEDVLSNVLLSQADEIITNIEETRSRSNCTDLDPILAEFNQLTQSGRGGESLRVAYEQITRRKDLACAEPTATPSPTLTPTLMIEHSLKFIRADKTGQEFIVDFRVLREGSIADDFKQDDFRVINEEKEIQLSSFSKRSSDDPVCLLAVVDNSGTIFNGISQIQDALTLLNQQKKSDDLLGLIAFESNVAADRTQELGKTPLDSSVIDGGGRLSAVYLAVDYGLGLLSQCPYEGKYLILLSDGDNNVTYKGWDTETAKDELTSKAENAGISICPVGIKSEQLKPDILSGLASSCEYYPATEFEGIANQFAQIFGYVRNFYRISFPRAGNEVGELWLQLILNDKVVAEGEIITNGNE